MKSTTVSIAEGKKGFSRLIQDASEKNEEIIVTKRGKPVAVIIAYNEHLHSGLRADEIYQASRKQLDKKP
jgi:prevent-host-death family protein